MSAELLAQLYETINDAVILIDNQQKIIAFNAGAEKTFGYAASEVIGQSLNVLLPDRYRQHHGDLVHAFALSNDYSRRMADRREIFGKRKNGKEFPAEAGITKIEVHDKFHFAVVLRDITDRKQWEEEKREHSNQLAITAERSRLARELHDAVTQSLFSANISAEVLSQVWEKDREQGLQQLQRIRVLTRSALAEMRSLLFELRPTALTDSKLSDLLRQLAETHGTRAGIKIEGDYEESHQLPSAIQIAFYRIAQEALNNISKHSRATQATVRLNVTAKSAIMLVEDNGTGFDLGSAPTDHFGLKIMRERAEEIGAVIEIESQLNQGTQVLVTWRN